MRSTRLQFYLFPAGILVVLLNVAAVAGMLQAEMTVLTALIFQLVIATCNFVLLILNSPRQPAEAQAESRTETGSPAPDH